MKNLTVCSLLVFLALPAAGLESHLVKDINPGPLGSNPRDLAMVDGAVLFIANGGLWRSDGTDGGTLLLTDNALEAVPQLPDLRPVQTGRLYFFLNGHRGLSVSDGTVGGTFELTGPEVRIEWQGAAALSLWVPSQGALYFVARDSDHGFELWRSDGTVAGTHLVADIRPGSQGSSVEWLTEYKGQVWFAADDGQHGGALWRTDGTAAGTVLAIDPVPSSASNAAPEHIRVAGDHLTFFASTPSLALSPQLWAGDGTVQGTAPITALSGSKGPTTLYDSQVQGNRLYFVAEDKKGQQLWASDGTRRGTRPLTRFAKRNALSGGPGFQPPYGDLNGRFLFMADDGVHGQEPWITDGTPGGTRLLRDICPGTCSGFPILGPVLGGRLYFTAKDPARGQELWSTDGRASTHIVSDICPGSCDSRPYAPFVVGNRLLFVAWDGQTGEEVWSTDGTAEGTVRITDFEPPFIWEEDGFNGAVLDGRLLFGAPDALHGMELWTITP